MLSQALPSLIVATPLGLILYALLRLAWCVAWCALRQHIATNTIDLCFTLKGCLRDRR